MLKLTPAQVTPAIRALFRTDEMQATRCFKVLEGSVPGGKIFVDDLEHPRWGLVQEAYDNDVFLGGVVDAAAFGALFAELRREGEVIVGLPYGDPRLALFPPGTYYDNCVLEFYDRPLGQGLDAILSQLPADCALRRLDRELILRTEWGPGDVAMQGGLDAWEQSCFGYALMRGNDILSEATVGPPALGLYEPGVFTQEKERGHGFGTLVTARLVQEIESLGMATYWNCTIQNLGSIGIARKLGYRVRKEFRCLAWRKDDVHCGISASHEDNTCV